MYTIEKRTNSSFQLIRAFLLKHSPFESRLQLYFQYQEEIVLLNPITELSAGQRHLHMSFIPLIPLSSTSKVTLVITTAQQRSHHGEITVVHNSAVLDIGAGHNSSEIHRKALEILIVSRQWQLFVKMITDKAFESWRQQYLRKQIQRVVIDADGRAENESFDYDSSEILTSLGLFCLLKNVI